MLVYIYIFLTIINIFFLKELSSKIIINNCNNDNCNYTMLTENLGNDFFF